jgi:protein-tyrosine-phosphatase
MTNKPNSKNSSNIFRRPRKGNSRAPHNSNAKVTGFHNPWRSPKDLPTEGELKTILFLSKRGMTRAPVAREVMRSLIERSEWFGKVDVFSAGVTKAYDECTIDQRMKEFCKEFGYRLQARSSFANPSKLADADIVISLDRASEEFVGLQKHSIRGKNHPLGVFMAPGCEPYVQDPYERDEDIDVDECYEDIISSIEYGCAKLSSALPTLI